MNTIILHNKLKLDEYKIHKSYIAGIVLQPCEVKAMLRGSCSLRGAYVHFHNGIIVIMKMYIHDTGYIHRPLLLRQSEINRIMVELTEGKSLIPRTVFKTNNLIKLDLILCSKLAKYESKKAEKLREMDYKEARRYNALKIKIK